METVRGRKVKPDNKMRVSKPRSGDRRCECGRKISMYNPNGTCWEHAPIRFPRIRGGKD